MWVVSFDSRLTWGLLPSGVWKIISDFQPDNQRFFPRHRQPGPHHFPADLGTSTGPRESDSLDPAPSPPFARSNKPPDQGRGHRGWETRRTSDGITDKPQVKRKHPEHHRLSFILLGPFFDMAAGGHRMNMKAFTISERCFPTLFPTCFPTRN